LSDVAEVKLVAGASFIYRENQQRYIPIKFSVRGRDLGGAVLEAQQSIAKEVRVPPGFHLECVGEFGELQEAISRLASDPQLAQEMGARGRQYVEEELSRRAMVDQLEAELDALDRNAAPAGD